MHSYNVKQQVERIIDEGHGAKRSVIVKIGSEGKDTRSISRAVALTLEKRKLALSARELVPPPRDHFVLKESGQLTASSKRKLKAANMSLISNIAIAGASALTASSLMASGLGAIIPAIGTSAILGNALQKIFDKKDLKKKEEEAAFLWMANSVAVDLKKDELHKLPADMKNVVGIYPNRSLNIPPLIEHKELPGTVADNKTSAWGINAIGALAAWGAYGAKGKGTKVAVLDTGINDQHPDLAGKVSDWAEFDRQGFKVEGSTPHDTHYHGTHCAGTIAGGKESGQWIGVAPEAKIAAGLVLDGETGGTDIQVLKGIQWAAELGVDVISMSLGAFSLDPSPSEVYTDTILSCLRMGIPVVAAIGNEGNQTTGEPGNNILAFSVGATDWQDRVAAFSGGRTQVITESDIFDPGLLPLIYSKPDVSAPGVSVKSCAEDSYKVLGGTSMATPHVAGAMALLLSATSIKQTVDTNQRAFLLMDMLLGSAEELGEVGKDHRFGFGRIDALRAIGFAKESGY